MSPAVDIVAVAIFPGERENERRVWTSETYDYRNVSDPKGWILFSILGFSAKTNLIFSRFHKGILANGRTLFTALSIKFLLTLSTTLFFVSMSKI